MLQHPYCIKNDADVEIENIPIWISEWLKSVCLEKKNLIMIVIQQKFILIEETQSQIPEI